MGKASVTEQQAAASDDLDALVGSTAPTTECMFGIAGLSGE
jgi:hypothetical protein